MSNITSSEPSRLDRIEALLERSIIASDERMTRMEQAAEARFTRLEQLVESNNRFLEAFSSDLRGYVREMQEERRRNNATIAGVNQDRQDMTSQLSAVRRKVDAIARHLGLDT